MSLNWKLIAWVGRIREAKLLLTGVQWCLTFAKQEVRSRQAKPGSAVQSEQRLSPHRPFPSHRPWPSSSISKLASCPPSCWQSTGFAASPSVNAMLSTHLRGKGRPFMKRQSLGGAFLFRKAHLLCLLSCGPATFICLAQQARKNLHNELPGCSTKNWRIGLGKAFPVAHTQVGTV